MPANDPLHNELRAAYVRFYGRRARTRRLAAAAALGTVAVLAAAVVGAAALNHSGTPAHASGPGSDAYIKCLNDHGWPVGPGLSIDPSGNAPAPQTVDAAVTACAELEHGVLDSLRPSDEALKALGDRADRFVSCMRAQGVDVGTPDLFRNRAGIGVTFPGLNPDAAGYDDAYGACKSILSAGG